MYMHTSVYVLLVYNIYIVSFPDCTHYRDKWLLYERCMHGPGELHGKEIKWVD